jgi:hypothetical protein
MGSTNLMANATTVRRSLELLLDAVAKTSPSKQRLVQCVLAKARAGTLLPFTQDEKLDGDVGSLVRLSKQNFLRTLVEGHDSGD